MRTASFISKKDLIYIILVFAITRGLIFFVGTICFAIFPERGLTYQKKPPIEILNPQFVWDKFDSAWYRKLASEGYPQRKFTINKQETWGYMPLYPMLLSALSRISGFNSFWCGLIISNVCCFFALLVFYRLVREKFALGLEVVNLALVSAGSFYLSIVYTEGLYVLLTCLVFYYTHQKKYVLALLIAGLATVTRVQGCLLFLIPGIEILITHPRTFYKNIPVAVLALVPLGAFMLYLNQTCGEPLAFIKIQAAWGSQDVFPLQGIKGLFTGHALITSTVNIGFWILSLGIVLSQYKKLPLSYIVFTIIYILLSTSNEIVYGTVRYMLGVVPIFIAVALSHRYVYQFFVLINIMFLVLTIAAFVTSTPLFI